MLRWRRSKSVRMLFAALKILVRDPKKAHAAILQPSPYGPGFRSPSILLLFMLLRPLRSYIPKFRLCDFILHLSRVGQPVFYQQFPDKLFRTTVTAVCCCI